MTIAPGTRLGPYEITSPLGVGGMGEVYRALDTNLKRVTAIKVLPQSVAADPDRLARFQREAEVLAALNHPNIAAVYGLERSGASIAMAMELVEGPTLADRIMQGAVPVDETLAMARQITEGLEAAHEQGIIHRDLKPANIKQRPDGTVKILDFGLAKALEPATAVSSGGSLSPTITSPALTQMGMLLGTAAYMSPEQARGRPVDKRADIWAFGCVLFELLTGRRAFARRRRVADTRRGHQVGSGLDRPAGAATHRAGVPATLPDQGFPAPAARHRRNAARALGGIRRSSRPSARHPRQRHRLAAHGGGRFRQRRSPPSPQRQRSCGFNVRQNRRSRRSCASRFAHPPAAGFLQALPRSRPDGRSIAYSMIGPDRLARLHVRDLHSTEARVLPGTENGVHPFWSADGRSLAFVTDRTLKRIDVAGGAPRELAEVTGPWHGSWGKSGEILFAAVGDPAHVRRRRPIDTGRRARREGGRNRVRLSGVSLRRPALHRAPRARRQKRPAPRLARFATANPAGR